MAERQIRCPVCMHHCLLQPGQIGRCRARKNENGKSRPVNYGRLTALALDPIEKKPLAMFAPGSRILSAGSFGCNLSCPFCQNYEISMCEEEPETVYVSPEMLAEKALELQRQGNIGVAYTYNEPLVGYEYVRDTAALVRRAGMKNVIVTNGSVTEEVLEEILPFSGRHRDFTHFNIPIAAELVPADLDRAAYQVGLVNGFAGGFPAGSPAPQGGHASKHACFTGTDSGTTNRLFILAGIPKIGNNGSATHLNSGCLGIFILVNHVLVNAEIHQHPDLLFIPGLAEGCKILAGIAVQHQFIGHQLESVLRAHRIIRELILGEKVICFRRTENGIFRPGCIGFLIWIKHDGIYCFIVSGPTVKGNPHEG